MTRIRADVLPVFTVSKNFVDLSPVNVTDAENSVKLLIATIDEIQQKF